MSTLLERLQDAAHRGVLQDREQGVASQKGDPQVLCNLERVGDDLGVDSGSDWSTSEKQQVVLHKTRETEEHEQPQPGFSAVQ